jgi:hypothetical protein
MSANLDLVSSIYAAWERGDVSTAEWAHPAIEFVIVGGPDPGSWKSESHGGRGDALDGRGPLYVCDGIVMRLVHYWEREHALADLGLAPETG